MIKLSQIKLNPSNPRLIKDDKFKKLVKSLQDFPQMMELRPIVVDENNVIQGGNMRFRALQELKYKEIPEVWIKQGKDLTPEQWREFVVKDNVGFGEWDWGMLANEWDVAQLNDWGVEVHSWGEDEEELYTKKIEAPKYEAKNEKPDLKDLINVSKYKELIEEIEKANIANTDKMFLRYAASRHIVFDYELIADYYSHSEKNIQELMENSALVIIDFNKAIENGLVKMSDSILEKYKADNE
jgi:hypothetical protein